MVTDEQRSDHLGENRAVLQLYPFMTKTLQIQPRPFTRIKYAKQGITLFPLGDIEFFTRLCFFKLASR